MHLIDRWVLANIFERLARLLGRWFGAIVPGLVRACATLSVVAALCSAAVMLLGHDRRVFLAAIVSLWPLLTTSSLLGLARNAERWPNDIFVARYPVRIFSLLVNMLLLTQLLYPDLAQILHDLSFLAWTAGLYFAACPPAPPKRQRAPALVPSIRTA